MQPRIENVTEKKLLGKKIKMSIIDNKTGELWRNFMPQRKEIKNIIGTELYSVEVYEPSYFVNFNPATEFDKWAAVEVSDYETIPEGMEIIILPGGLYAVFIHKGPASAGFKTYQYIFTTWLPNTEFLLDERPHFAIMGEKYKNEDPDSEEEIWVPIQKKIQPIKNHLQ